MKNEEVGSFKLPYREMDKILTLEDCGGNVETHKRYEKEYHAMRGYQYLQACPSVYDTNRYVDDDAFDDHVDLVCIPLKSPDYGQAFVKKIPRIEHDVYCRPFVKDDANNEVLVWVDKYNPKQWIGVCSIRHTLVKLDETLHASVSLDLVYVQPIHRGQGYASTICGMSGWLLGGVVNDLSKEYLSDVSRIQVNVSGEAVSSASENALHALGDSYITGMLLLELDDSKHGRTFPISYSGACNEY
ncbi:MAG: hypothetical protein C9356_20280 [Oleiphilus sp.]|nr:MAG: hypothetical protein C9356_20280 [Oleiphilus sp.]